MSIASELARIIQAKADLKTAINNKGGNITTEKIDQFASKVTALPSPKEEETKTLTPNFSSGNQVITPTSGKVLSQVTLTKPTDLIPENIAKDKNICGVVGTLEGGVGDVPYLTIKIRMGYESSYYYPVQIQGIADNTISFNIRHNNYSMWDKPVYTSWVIGMGQEFLVGTNILISQNGSDYPGRVQLNDGALVNQSFTQNELSTITIPKTYLLATGNVITIYPSYFI